VARLNIEDHAFGDVRFDKLGRMMKKAAVDFDDLWTYAARAIVERIWHESQAEQLVFVTEKQIEKWTALDNIAPLIEQAGLIELQADGTYEVRGNAMQIAGMQKWMEQRSVAGKASAAKRTSQKQNEATKSNDRSTTVQRPLNEIQRPFNETQRDPNELQRNATQLQLQDQIQIQDQELRKRHICQLGQEASTENAVSPIGSLDAIASGLTDFPNSNSQASEGEENSGEVPTPSEPPQKLPRAKKTGLPVASSCDRIKAIWNEHKSDLQPAVRELNVQRKASIMKRLELFPNFDDWIEAVKNVAQWDWGNGSGGWIADFEWLVSNKGLKAFEGKLSCEKKPTFKNRPLMSLCPSNPTTKFGHDEECV